VTRWPGRDLPRKAASVRLGFDAGRIDAGELQPSIISRGWGAVMGEVVVTLLLGVGVAAWYGWATWRGLQSRSWIPADGVVTAIETPRLQSSDNPTTARRLRYRYEVAGRRYAGDRRRFGAQLIYGSETAVHLDAAGDLSVGSAVTVYHDPKHPEQSVLVRGPSAVGIVFLLAGVGMIASALWTLCGV
jgi:hypothetical protein